MSTTTAKGSGSTVNNGGTVVAGGTLGSDSPMTEVLNVNELNTGSEYGSKVKENATSGAAGYVDPAGVTKAVSGGTFAYTPAKGTNFLMRAAGDNASKVNNSASTVLSIPGGVGTQGNIHKIVDTRRLGAYSDASFNVLALPSSGVVPGRTKGTGAGSDSNFVQMDGSTAATDDAASPTRSVPGELTYMFGSVVPKQDDYKAKNSYES